MEKKMECCKNGDVIYQVELRPGGFGLRQIFSGTVTRHRYYKISRGTYEKMMNV